MNKDCFLVFSDDFGEHPTSCQHIFRHVPGSFPILWVNTIGMRSPKISVRDFKKIILKTRKMIYGFITGNQASHVNNIRVFQPFMLPFQNIPLIRMINRFLVCRSVGTRLKKLDMSSPVVVVTAPNACDYIGWFSERKVVYYCVDDFEEWPGLNKDLVRTMEDELITKTDLFIATSQNLYRKLSRYGKKVYLLTHGVDLELFKSRAGGEHHFLENIPKPRVGYFGLFDERSDQNLILILAKHMPEVSFVITGDIEVDISMLKKEKNIYFTGSVPYNELPAMAGGWNVCMLPYKVNRLTNNIQPLKIKEYLSTGKPVISTPIKEAYALKDYISIAETVDDWVMKIRDAIEGGPSIGEDRALFLQEEAWETKASRFIAYCLSDN